MSDKIRGAKVRFSKKRVRTVGELMMTDPKSRKFVPSGVRIRYRWEWRVTLFISIFLDRISTN